MPFYKFKAERKNGEVYEAKRNAIDKFSLYKSLRDEGDTVIFADEIKDKKLFGGKALKSLFSRVSTKEKIFFARNLGSMLKAGLPLSRALSVIGRQAKNKALQNIIKKIGDSINQGKSFSDALKDFPGVFSSLFVSMVRAGEESGSMSDSLRGISEQMDGVYQIQRKVKGAMIYPAIVITVIIIIAIVMLIYVVPTLTAIFDEAGAELPLNTRLVIFVSEAIKNHLILFITSIIAVGFLFAYARRTEWGKNLIATTVIKIPVVSAIVKESNSARTARTLSSLLDAGVEVVQSVEITSEVIQNLHFRKVLLLAKNKIKKGETMSSVFAENSKLYPIFVSEMVSIGEETGELGKMLNNVAEYYEEEVAQKTKDLSVIIEPVLMVVIGCAVAFFALSMLAPMYSLVNTI